MTSAYYQEILKRLESMSKEEKIDYLNEILEHESEPYNRKDFYESDELIEAYSDYDCYLAAWRENPNRKRFFEKIIKQLEQYENESEITGHYLIWKADREKLEILVNELEKNEMVIFEDKEDFIESLIKKKIPTEKNAKFILAKNALMDLIKQLIDYDVLWKDQEDSLSKCVSRYFYKKDGSKFSWNFLKGEEKREVSERNIQKIDTVLNSLK